MRIESLKVDDFGILRNVVMDGMDPHLLVIAGPNRSGKSTLMQIFRYLGYRFPRTSNFPAGGDCRISGEIRMQNGNRVRVTRAGHAEPEFTLLGENTVRLPVEDVYGNIDGFTYGQVFTISLDELRRVPEAVGAREQARLQSVLLGAGLKEIAELPNLEQEFGAAAEKIGGKYGKPSVGEFRDHSERIREGTGTRRKALRQVADYAERQRELQDVEEQIRAKLNEIKEASFQKDWLEYVKHNFTRFVRYGQLKTELNRAEAKQLLSNFDEDRHLKASRLSEHYGEVLEDFAEARERFERSVQTQNPDRVLENLLIKADEIRYWERNLSALEERIASLREDTEHHQTLKNQIIGGIKQLDESLGDDFGEIQKVRIDAFSMDEVRRTAGEIEGIGSKKERLEEEIERLEAQALQRTEQLERLEGVKPAFGKGIFLGLALASLGGGLYVGYQMDRWLGMGLMVGGAILVSAIGVMWHQSHRSVRTEYHRVKSEKGDVDKQLARLKDRHNDLEFQERESRERLEAYKQAAKLSGEIPPELLVECYHELSRLKQDIANWHAAESRLIKRREKIETDLKSLKSLLRLLSFDFHEAGEALAGAPGILDGLRKVIAWLDLAELFQQVRQKKTKLESEISEALWGSLPPEFSKELSVTDDIEQELERTKKQGQQHAELRQKQQEMRSLFENIQSGYSERVHAAFQHMEDLEEGEEGFEVLFDRLCLAARQFVSEESVQESLDSARKRYERANREWEEWKNREKELQQELKGLAATERLDRAKEDIDRERGKMERKAREYGVNRLAELMVRKLRERYLEKMRGTLLSGASSIFNRLTSRDYHEILPPEDFVASDFQILPRDGERHGTTDTLSRGTREQLFLAVRISRIMEIDPPLPVVLDDTLANFDVVHQRRAAEITEELSGRNQVIVLTCHPELVDYIRETAPDAQYWYLQGGGVSRQSYSEVVRLLRSGDSKSRDPRDCEEISI